MTEHDPYDLVIVGAGPSGLSAARTVARLGFRTLVIERLAGPGELGHPCNAALVSAPGFITGRPFFGGLLYPQIDLWIPESLIKGHDGTVRWLSPGGYELQTLFMQDHESPTALIDKAGLMMMLTEQAMSSGAEFIYDTEVLGLLHDGEQVSGVRTTAGDFPAALVLSAEGTSRTLCEQAGLFAAPARTQTLILTQELSAPQVTADDLGQVITLGRCGASLPPGFGSLTLPEPGRAVLTYTAFVDDLDCASAGYAAEHLGACRRDQRVRDLLEGAAVLSSTWQCVPLQDAPLNVVTDGFMGIGDAITPAGHLGILPAMFLGRQAALIAAEALDSGDVSEAYLAPYEQLYSGLILPLLDSEAKTTVALTRMTDNELDRLCQLLNWLHLPVPFLGYQRSAEWDTVRALVRQSSLETNDWELLKRVLPGADGAPANPLLIPVFAPLSFETPTLGS